MHILGEFVTFVDALPIAKHQFQCISHSGYQLCMFPEQYCHSSAYHSECRPCSKNISDKLNDDDFPLQCSYNCTAGKCRLSLYYCKGEEEEEEEEGE